MTRSWTDPRTGKRWYIDTVRQPRSPRDKHVGRGEPEMTPALMFESPEASYAVPTVDAGRLESLEDDRLAELLDQARVGGGPPPQSDLRDSTGPKNSEGRHVRGPGQASPTAAGRESQPHRDPAEEGD